jgi:hypothetical protein
LVLVFVVPLVARLIPHQNDNLWGGFAAALSLFFMMAAYAAYFWAGIYLARAKGYSYAMIFLGICPPAQLFILPLLFFGLPDKRPQPADSRSGRVRRHSENQSPIARIVRCRRNALVAIYFGMGGIALALSFIFLPRGLFETRDDARAVAVLVFVPSYAAVIYGSLCWVRAKCWSDGVILIGLLPLVVLGIRYVRLIYLAVPLLLPAGMVVMPIILVGVIAVLPDKSGLPKRKR